jgi:dTDP-4-dehydrorhamnose 3,5-epimerase
MKTYGESLPGVEVITHTKFKDSRGDFCELWKSDSDKMRGTFRQINLASSKYNVLRGMHRQDQSKLVMPLFGEIFDVALDVESKKWFGVVLDNTTALFIPPQYAHGYLVLSETSLVQYVVDMPYNKPLEENFRWDSYSIVWPTPFVPILSDKDA